METNNSISASNQFPQVEINNKPKKMVSLFLNPFFYWILLTIIYSLFMYFQWHYIVGIIGLFVPLGLFSLLYLFGAPLLWLGSFFLVLFVVWSFNKIIKKYKINPIVNVILIFIILFLLTMFVDYIFYGKLESLKIFQHGGYIMF